jgi:ribulose-phosphate 3-epimerase
MNMIKVAPSILSADFSRLGEEIRAVENAGADLIHIDVMDGMFVPNITIGSSVIESLRRITKLPFDVHLMIESPERYISNFRSAGSDFITVHVETCRHLHRTINQIKESGARAGVALNPSTSLGSIEQILSDIDLVTVMTVDPGFGGQKFIPSMLKKIAEVRQLIDRSSQNIELEIDGGVTIENASSICQAGADILVGGASVFKSPDYALTIRLLKNSVTPQIKNARS